MKMFLIIKVFICSIPWVLSTIDGLTYMDPINLGPYQSVRGEDPCNPLYWYPRSMPDYCYQDKTPKSIAIPAPPPAIPMPPPTQPIPPMSLPQPYPMPLLPMPPVFMPPLFPPSLMSAPVPYASGHMLPIAGIPYPSPPALPFHYQPQQQIGFLPGLPGIVSDDGGINILPFSDAYADLLEKHKQKMITKKYMKVVGDYGKYPWKSRRKSRCH